jgi:hypothetical protein
MPAVKGLSDAPLEARVQLGRIFSMITMLCSGFIIVACTLLYQTQADSKMIFFAAGPAAAWMFLNGFRICKPFYFLEWVELCNVGFAIAALAWLAYLGYKKDSWKWWCIGIGTALFVVGV